MGRRSSSFPVSHPATRLVVNYSSRSVSYFLNVHLTVLRRCDCSKLSAYTVSLSFGFPEVEYLDTLHYAGGYQLCSSSWCGLMCYGSGIEPNCIRVGFLKLGLVFGDKI